MKFIDRNDLRTYVSDQLTGVDISFYKVDDFDDLVEYGTSGFLEILCEQIDFEYGKHFDFDELIIIDIFDIINDISFLHKIN